uniref:Predicted protein n=1 Tax=Hordeum vulgare subsp. vulgare TaxID=112509 RepID=F2DJ10_HORVV|nr:predicted protein [Hordeum vulgare subsp. vulgare]
MDRSSAFICGLLYVYMSMHRSTSCLCSDCFISVYIAGFRIS